MNGFELLQARSLKDALGMLADTTPATVLAGGTDLLPLMHDRLISPARLVSLKLARDLRYLRFDDDGSSAHRRARDIGRPRTRIRRARAAADLSAGGARRGYAAVACHSHGRRQSCCSAIAAGTFAGRIPAGCRAATRASPVTARASIRASSSRDLAARSNPSDLAPALVALEAMALVSVRAVTARCQSPNYWQHPPQIRRVENRLGADEVIVEVSVPPQLEGARGVYLKVMDRQAWAFALASAAAQVTVRDGRIERIRIVLGSVASVPWRVPAAEALLEGQPLTPELAVMAADRLMEGAAPLAHNGYKVRLARELARRVIVMAGER